MDIYLGAISYELGESRPISDLREFHDDPARLKRFHEMGMGHYRAGSRSAMDMAFASLKGTVERAGARADSFDGLIYCSEGAGEFGNFQEVGLRCEEAGLSSAFPLGVSLSSCGNFASGLQLAVALLRGGYYENILLVTSDRHVPERGSRLMEPAVGIVSDGAASCMLSSKRPLEFRIHDVDLLANHRMSRLCPEREYLAFSLESYRGRKEIFRRVLEALPSKGPESIRRLVPNNYGLNTLKGFSAESGIPMERVHGRNVSPMGHVNSADNLINLQDCQDGLDDGDMVFLLSTGPFTWGVALIEKTGISSKPTKEMI